MSNESNNAAENMEAEERWPGHVELDHRGVEIAVEMLDALADLGEDSDDLNASDHTCVENWPRRGKPHRNTFLEFLWRAREAGPAAEAAFCAIAGDFIGINVVGSSQSPDHYAEMYGIE